jgi:hypothetical protein
MSPFDALHQMFIGCKHPDQQPFQSLSALGNARKSVMLAHRPPVGTCMYQVQCCAPAIACTSLSRLNEWLQKWRKARQFRRASPPRL